MGWKTILIRMKKLEGKTAGQRIVRASMRMARAASAAAPGTEGRALVRQHSPLPAAARLAALPSTRRSLAAKGQHPCWLRWQHVAGRRQRRALWPPRRPLPRCCSCRWSRCRSRGTPLRLPAAGAGRAAAARAGATPLPPGAPRLLPRPLRCRQWHPPTGRMPSRLPARTTRRLAPQRGTPAERPS